MSGTFDPEGDIEKAILKHAEEYPRKPVNDFTYGTAGFRMREELLDWIMYGVGILAAVRSRYKAVGAPKGATIGVMITASHNKAEDNGVKLVDPMGDMLDQEWEHFATALANARTPHELLNKYKEVMESTGIRHTPEAHVIFARDTRPSGARLVKALEAGLKASKAQYTDYGFLTTPQLHYLVRAINTQHPPHHPYGEPSEDGYYKKLADAFSRAMKYTDVSGPLTVDCANGVGAPKLKELVKHLPKDKLAIRIVNDNIHDPAVLNHHCGADFVKTQQRSPENFSEVPFERWASLDGDADRIVYHYCEEGNVFRLLDGDRIATLAAGFIGELVRKAGLEEKIKLAVVQTAYANGSSTKFIEQNLKLKVEFTPTGVKHLHHVAARYDIGVYFEANGHGTVLFHPQALRTIHKHQPESPAQLECLETLKALTDLINQTVGDALSDMLLVEVVLAHKEYTVREWLATYKDLPNKLAKVKVADRSDYKTLEGTAERKLKAPDGIQAFIDATVSKYRDGRCFVRASGTEDAVRVYAEAAEVYDVENMVNAVVTHIQNRDSANAPAPGAAATQPSTEPKPKE